MIIHFLRHGKTVANEQRRYCGSADQPLSSGGIEQLRQLKTEKTFPTAERYVTSSLQRTIETLKILHDKSPDMIIEELNEYNFGDFEMKNYDELKNNPDYLRWIGGNENIPCPNGESRQKFKERIKHGFKLVQEMNVNSVFVVCHGGVIASLMGMLFGDRKKSYDEWLPQNAHGYTIEISGTTTAICKPL
ncbi:MAG: phosphoglycerate mutase family protein [Planctomycetaceae bacterium]|jgi:alpha-ribazole phosphatase|nr:phosphoglycerate mutase family protein [Planctomycetaceae bacterium]